VIYDILYYSMFGASLLLSLMGLWFTAVIPGIDRWNRRFFMNYFLIFLLGCLSGIAEMIFQAYLVPGVVFVFLLIAETLLLSLPLLMLTVYLLHCCGENLYSSSFFYAALGLWGLFLILSASTPFISGVVRFTPDNQYSRGPLYPLFLLPAIALLLLNFVWIMKSRMRLSRKVFLAFLITILPITAALIVHLFVDVFPLIDLSYVISALAMYSFILSDQIDEDRLRQQEIILQERKIADQQREIARQQRKIAHERASVMVLQMRPHFIFNTLISIHGLCRIDPQKARQVTMDFTDYLRRNFNAVASDSTTPFSTELKHTRAYLAVEQAQYDDMLVVDYDTPFINFRLPPLTLQPIVENSVKHGMNPRSEPLHICIRTRHMDSGTELIVEDNGPGFEHTETEGMGIALENIRKRLGMMCAGKLDVVSHHEGGTTVIVTIPDQ
jgi:sensor histidine kinase YesM